MAKVFPASTDPDHICFDVIGLDPELCEITWSQNTLEPVSLSKKYHEFDLSY